ncbi:hypothetical protein ABZU45_32215 [Streptomyces avermitilis]|uniref:hypothetical protein n=1 Tax=Streptomyces avermitilis TaxID=33903 RepID=UPI0033A03FB1
MVGIYFTGNSGDPCDATRPCLTSLSLDRHSTPDALITSQIATKGGGPLIRWPLSASTAPPDTNTANDYTGTVTATGAYTVPIWKVQGAATDGTYYYFSGECPETAGTTDSDVPYCIHRPFPTTIRPLPPELHLRRAVLADPLSVALHAELLRCRRECQAPPDCQGEDEASAHCRTSHEKTRHR